MIYHYTITTDKSSRIMEIFGHTWTQPIHMSQSFPVLSFQSQF